MNRYLGIELGSTRIKAVTLNEELFSVGSGEYTWASDYENGIWTYDLTKVWEGIRQALRGVGNCSGIRCAGISGMMHGLLAFDRDWNLLTPFRTWQNTITGPAAEELTKLFTFNIPQRWSIAHLYQVLLNKEVYAKKIAHITTLAGYIHYMLTGVNAVGIGEASGIFPVDSDRLDYNEKMLDQFDVLIQERGLPWRVREVLPAVLPAGASAGCLTPSGSLLLDGLLSVGVPFAPPEGDAGTGMTATNAVAAGTGNVSAGTSIFSMVVLERPLETVYEEIDMVATPSGKPVAMVHCNNCTADNNAWTGLLAETAGLFGVAPSKGEVFTKLYEKSLEGEPDCGGILVCNYLAGEGVTHLDAGRPLVVRRPDSRFTLANFIRGQLYGALATLKLGMEILAGEQVTIRRLTGHGGLFKTPGVGQRYLAAACNAPVTCMESAGEGGPYGMALLASYMDQKMPGELLETYLDRCVFSSVSGTVFYPDARDVEGFNTYMEQYKHLLLVEKTAVEVI